MKHYVGLDVSMKETSVCVVDEEGKIKAENVVATDPKTIATYLGHLELPLESVGLESGSLSHWLTEELLKRELPVKCIDARHCSAFLSLQINKTDRNDARGIAEVMRCNIFRQVQLKSRAIRETSALLVSREQLVTQRTQILMSIRGILKPFGILLGAISKTKSGIMKLWARINTLELDPAVLQGIEALMKATLTIAEGIADLDKQVKEVVKNEPRAQLLMTIPGVGPVTALKYLVEVGDPARFKKSRSVGAYVGLTPSQYASGETQRQGRISKRGSRSLRSLLVEAAIVLMTRTRSWSKLKAWGLRLMKTKGLKKAATAVARKLAVVMHRMLLTGEDFRYGEAKVVDQVA